MPPPGRVFPFPWLACLAFGIGALITWGVAHRAHQWERQRAREQFQHDADMIQSAVEREAAQVVEVLDSIRALHDLSGAIREEMLAEFVEKGMLHQRAILGAFGFAQRIGHPLRVVLEEAYAAAPETGYRITRKGPDHTWIPAETAPFYFPLTWQSHPDGLRVPIGYDFAATETVRHAILRMHTQRAAVLVTEAEEGTHWIFSPIGYDRAGTPSFIGFAVARLQPSLLLERAATGPITNQEQLRLIPPPAGATNDIETDPRIDVRPGGEWRYRATTRIVDTHWLLEYERPVNDASGRGRRLWTVGLVISLLVALQVANVVNRTRRIEELVEQRTREWATASRQLEEQVRECERLEAAMDDAAAREQKKLGRDLHDSLGQKLTGAVFLSRALARHLADRHDAQSDHAHTLTETLKESVQEVRAMARGLTPVAASAERLDDALAQLASEITGRYRIPCQWEGTNGDADLTVYQKEQLYLIAREAAHNAARHADATAICIQLHARAPGRATLIVEDNGKGLADNADTGPGLGLHTMRYRARHLKASIQFAPPATGHGLRVTVDIHT